MRVIVLTRSDKHYTEEEGGYCIAGLDYDDRTRWVRLLGQHYKMKIANAEAVYEVFSHVDDLMTYIYAGG